MEKTTRECEIHDNAFYFDLWFSFANSDSFYGRSEHRRKAIMMSLVNQTFPLFRPPYVVEFFACSVLHFGTFMISAGMAMFLPDILNRLSRAREAGYGDDLRICYVLQSVKTSNDSGDADYVSRLGKFDEARTH